MGPSSSSCSKGSVPSSDARLEQDSKLLMLLKILANGFSKTHPDFWEHEWLLILPPELPLEVRLVLAAHCLACVPASSCGLCLGPGPSCSGGL